MNDADGRFLSGLGFKEGPGGAWRLFLRKGNVLLVLPDSPEGIRMGLGLYRPQKALAAMVVKLVRVAPFRMFFLPRWQAGPEVGGPVCDLLEKVDGRLAGVLLGNPQQEARRAILILETKSGHLKVAKVGATPAAVEKIQREMTFLQKNAGAERMIPQVGLGCAGDGWAAFTMAFQEAPKVLTHAELCKLFRSWMSGGAMYSMDHFNEWEDLKRLIEAHETEKGVEMWEMVKLRKTIRHGDLAPWNILGSEESEQATVIDWEFGEVESIPGLDLVHYLYIPAILVDGMEPLKALAFVRDLLQSDDGFRKLLGEWGWHERVDLLLKTYFYSMKGELENFSEMARAV